MTIRKSIWRACVVGALTASTFGSPTPAASPGSVTGTAIGNAVKSFADTVFPGGTALLTLVNNWVRQKLNGSQQTDIKSNADTQKTTVTDPKVNAAKADLQQAAKTLQVVSIIVYHANNISTELADIDGILSGTPKDAALPFDDLNPHWNNVKGEWAIVGEDQTIKNGKAGITDEGVAAALLEFDQAMHGPVTTIGDYMKPGGNRDIIAKQLQVILTATHKINNLSVVLLGSTGSSINTTINNLAGAGGGSDLDQKADSVSAQANGKLTKRAQ